MSLVRGAFPKMIVVSPSVFELESPLSRRAFEGMTLAVALESESAASEGSWENHDGDRLHTDKRHLADRGDDHACPPHPWVGITRRVGAGTNGARRWQASSPVTSRSRRGAKPSAYSTSWPPADRRSSTAARTSINSQSRPRPAVHSSHTSAKRGLVLWVASGVEGLDLP